MPRTSRTTRTALQAVELGLAAPQVVAHRLTRMALAGHTPSPRDRQEFTGMVVEKQVAFAQAWMAMFAEGLRLQQELALSWMRGASAAQQSARAKKGMARIAGAGLAPVHRKATSNAKRLARTRLR
jgi:hypothetical protein